MLLTHIDRRDAIQGWTSNVPAVPNWGQTDQDAGTARRDLVVGGVGKHRDLNSIGLADKDADIEAMEECGLAVGEVIGTRLSESRGVKLRLRAEPQEDHSSPVEQEGSHSSLVGRTSKRHCLFHMDRRVA